MTELTAPELAGPVAVTGATGFIGRAVCTRLGKAGIPTRALVRRERPELHVDVELIRGELDDALALDHLVAGCSLVVHCAGAVRGATRAAFDAVNLEGTRNLLTAIAREAPGVRVVHLSSLAAREPGLSDYAASKHAADQLYLDGTRSRWTILRPTAVYGPGDRELLPLLKSMARGIAPVPTVADARVTLIHVEDVVAAILAAAGTPDAIEGCYELSDARSTGYSWDELCTAVATLRDGKVRKLPLPVPLLRAAGWINERLARVTGHAPMLSSGKVRELTHPDWSCATQRFMDTTGWTPAIDLATGLASVLDGT